jgi:hypothetical protein
VAVPSFDTLKQTSDLSTSSSYSVAHLRHQPLSSVAHLMLDRVEHFDFFTSSADEAVERLMLCWMGLELLYGDVAESQHRLLGELAHKGMVLAEAPDLGEEGAGMLDFALQGLVVRLSSLLFPHTYADGPPFSALRSANRSS